MVMPFFELPIKNLEETYKKIIHITGHSGYYTRGNLLDYEYFKEHYKLIAMIKTLVIMLMVMVRIVLRLNLKLK